MSPPPTLIFQSTQKLKAFLDAENRGGCRLVSTAATVVGIYFQMSSRQYVEVRTEAGTATITSLPQPIASSRRVSREWRVMAVSISASDEKYVLDLDRLDPCLVTQVLRELFEDGGKIKVMHDIHVAARWLNDYGLMDVTLRKCIDTQLAYETYVDTSLLDVSSDALMMQMSALGPVKLDNEVKASLLAHDDKAQLPISALVRAQSVSEQSPFTWHSKTMAHLTRKPSSRAPTRRVLSVPHAAPFGPRRATSDRSVASTGSREATSFVAPRSAPIPPVPSAVLPAVGMDQSISFDDLPTLSREASMHVEGAAVSSPSPADASTSSVAFATPVAEPIGDGVHRCSKRENEGAGGNVVMNTPVRSKPITVDSAMGSAGASSPGAPSGADVFSVQGLVDALPPQSPPSAPAISVPPRFTRFAAPREQINGNSVFGHKLSMYSPGRFGCTNSKFVAIFEKKEDPLSPRNPLFNDMVWALTLAAAAVRTCAELIMTNKNMSPFIFVMTAQRWASAVANLGHASVTFDLFQHTPRSPESFLIPLPPTQPLRVLCDTSALFALLPFRISQLIKANADKCLTGVTDICMDAGRPPVFIVNGKHQKMSNGIEVSSAPVTRLELESIINRAAKDVGTTEFSRVCLRSLHRLAVIRAATPSQEVTALTLRIGRVVNNKAYMVTDLLFANRSKSIVVTGRQGSGKSTLLRDIVRAHSGKQDGVYVIDTWNELGGGAADAHDCLGTEARRCMVPSRELQSAVIRSCIRNYSVHTLVIDEVELDDDFAAMWSAKQHGIRLVAGVRSPPDAVQSRAGLNQDGHCLFESLVDLDAEDFAAIRVRTDIAQSATSQTRVYNSATTAVTIKATP